MMMYVCIFVPFCVDIFQIQAIIPRGRLVSLSITNRDHPFLRGLGTFAQNVRWITICKKRKFATKQGESCICISFFFVFSLEFQGIVLRERLVSLSITT